MKITGSGAMALRRGDCAGNLILVEQAGRIELQFMPSRADQPHDHAMSFGDHLEELRRRILLALAVPLPLALVIFALNQVFDNVLIEWLRLPVSNALRSKGLTDQMQVLSPTEMVVLQMKLCVIAGLVLSAPWVLYQAWKFIEPGLYNHEKRFVHFLLPFSAVLTVAGIALLYFAMLPLMLRVLIAFGMMGTSAEIDSQIADVLKSQPSLRIVSEPPSTPTIGDAWLTWPALQLYVTVNDGQGNAMIREAPRSWVKQEFRLSEYVNLVLMLMVAIALAFQMPLVVALLGWMGLATPEWLRKRRRYALLICGVISVVITPPDALSALIMLLPLYGLYELGILLLVIAPASAVARGRVFSLRRFRESPADNSREPMDRPRQTTQTDQSISRQSRVEQSVPPDVDGRGDGS